MILVTCTNFKEIKKRERSFKLNICCTGKMWKKEKFIKKNLEDSFFCWKRWKIKNVFFERGSADRGPLVTFPSVFLKISPSFAFSSSYSSWFGIKTENLAWFSFRAQWTELEDSKILFSIYLGFSFGRYLNACVIKFYTSCNRYQCMTSFE